MVAKFFAFRLCFWTENIFNGIYIGMKNTKSMKKQYCKLVFLCLVLLLEKLETKNGGVDDEIRERE